MCVCVGVHACAHAYMCVHACMCGCMHACVCVCVCVYVCVCMYMCVCVCQLSSEFPEEEDLVSVLQCVVTNDQSHLEPLVIRDGSELFFWQVGPSAMQDVGMGSSSSEVISITKLCIAC